MRVQDSVTDWLRTLIWDFVVVGQNLAVEETFGRMGYDLAMIWYNSANFVSIVVESPPTTLSFGKTFFLMFSPNIFADEKRNSPNKFDQAILIALHLYICMQA